MYDLDDLINLG